MKKMKNAKCMLLLTIGYNFQFKKKYIFRVGFEKLVRGGGGRNI